MKTLVSNWIYMLNYSWSVSRRVFLATGIFIMLDTVEPFVLLIIPQYILDELTGPARWERVLLYILLLI